MLKKEEIYTQLEKRHGAQLQKKLEKAHVCICGLGGLGSHVAVILARLGVGHLHLIDFDQVELSNIHRQNYTLEQIGMKKTQACKQNIERINPYIEITISDEKITENNYQRLIQEDIICEAFDQANTKAWFVNEILEKYPKKYIVASSGMVGLDSANGIQTRKITSHFFICGDEISDLESGLNLFASRVVICAAHQAHTVLKIIQKKEGSR